MATTDSRGLVGVSSACVQHNPQLRMDLWYYRAFVARAHRKSNVAATLAMTGRDHPRERFVKRRGHACGGAIQKVENDA